MRLDIRELDQVLLARLARSYLNGVYVPQCVMADEEAGIVEVWETDERGMVKGFRNEETGTMEPRTKLLTGVVKIVLDES